MEDLLHPLLLAAIARTTSCGAPPPPPPVAAAAAADPCAPLPPLAEGVPVESTLYLPPGFAFAHFPVAEESTRLEPGAYVDVILQPAPQPGGERPPARTVAHDVLFEFAGRAHKGEIGLWMSPIHHATVITDATGVAALEEARHQGVLSLERSDGREGVACEPDVREYRQWQVARDEPDRPRMAPVTGPPASAVALTVPAVQEAGFHDPATFVDVALGPRTIARGVLYLSARWSGPTPEVKLLADASSAAAIREAAAQGPVTFAPVTEGEGLTADAEARAWARHLRW